MVNRGLSIYDVIPAGFEPTTHSLEGCCSIQLSYETIFSFLKKRCKSKPIFGNIQHFQTKTFRTVNLLAKNK